MAENKTCQKWLFQSNYKTIHEYACDANQDSADVREPMVYEYGNENAICPQESFHPHAYGYDAHQRVDESVNVPLQRECANVYGITHRLQLLPMPKG